MKTLAVKLWESFPILCIQTVWELSDYAEDRDILLKTRAKPQAEPFAIVDKDINTEDMPTQPIGRAGVLVTMEDNWFYD